MFSECTKANAVKPQNSEHPGSMYFARCSELSAFQRLKYKNIYALGIEKWPAKYRYPLFGIDRYRGLVCLFHVFELIIYKTI